MKKKSTKKVQYGNCVTHHSCKCLAAELERLRKVARISRECLDGWREIMVCGLGRNEMELKKALEDLGKVRGR